MKKLMLVVVMLICSLSTLMAKNISQKEASQIARNFASSQFNSKSGVNNVYTIADNSNNVGIYVFNLAEGGWVMVSAEDGVRPILAYSPEGEYNPANVAPATTEYVGSFIDAINAVRTDHIACPQYVKDEWAMVRQNGCITAEKDGNFVLPLVQTRWNQSAPYNEYVPSIYVGGNSHVPVGCVATAMAQLVRYWEFPISGTGYHSYYCSFDGNPDYGYQYSNFGTTVYDYSLMPFSLSWSNTSAEIDMVARLGRDCGVAVDMMYGPSGSGAYSEKVPSALANYFRYSPDAQIKYKDSYSESTWIDMLKSDINAGRPLYSSGSSSSGGGHAYVCDGYDENNHMHYNWGWGGSGDGYFAVNALYVSGYSFNQWQAAIFNLHPTTTCNPPLYLKSSQVGNKVVLNWNPNGSDSYNVYRNGIQIAANLTVTTFTDNTATEGYFEYYVTSNCSATSESYESNTVVGITEAPSYCNVTVHLLNRSHGGGWGNTGTWGGAKLLAVHADGTADTMTWGGSNIYILPFETNSACSFMWIPGTNDSDCAFEVFYQDGTLVFASDVLGVGLVYSFVVDCGSTYGYVSEDFETNSFGADGWGTNNGWTVTSTDSHESSYSMTSNTNNSTIEFTHSATENSEVSFYAKATSGNIMFFVDGQQQQMTTANDWNDNHFTVGAGTHTYKWKYQGSGSAYVDNVRLPFNGTPVQTPADFTAVSNVTDVELNWEPVGYNYTGFGVYRNGELIGTTDAATTTWKETVFEDGTFSYNVSAMCGQRESSLTPSQTVNIAIPCNVPENLHEVSVSANAVKIEWDLGGTPSVDEDFESYIANEQIALQCHNNGSTQWTTFSNAIGSSQDSKVSAALSASGVKSMRVKDNDMVLLLNDRNTGHYVLSMKAYIFSGDDMAINLLQMFGNTKQYGGQLKFGNILHNGVSYTASFHVGNGYKPFNYTANEWLNIVYDINIDENRASLTIDGQTIVEVWEFDWTLGDIGIAQLAGIEFYASTNSCFFVDDIKLTSVYNTTYNVYRNNELLGTVDGFCYTDKHPLSTEMQYKVSLNCNSGESDFSNTLNVLTGIAELTSDMVTIYPNPTSGNFTMMIENVDFASVEIIDMATGQVVETFDYNGGQQAVELKNMAAGTYALRAVSTNNVIVKKITIN